MRRSFFGTLLLLLLIGRSGIALDTIKFGVFSSGSPEVMVNQWSPLLDYLSQEVGIPFEIVLREDYRGMLEALKQKAIDLTEGGPRTNITAIDQGLGEALARLIRFDSNNYHTVIVVSAQGPLLQLHDLQAKRFALVDELSTFGYLFPRIALHKAGITNPETFFHQIFLTGSHERSIDAVLEGVVDGAAVLDAIYHTLAPAKRAQLRVIHQSAPIPYEDIVIRTGLEPALREKIRAALLHYHERVPIETRHTVTIERVVPIGIEGNSYAAIRSDLALGETLPKLTYAIPYQRTPAVIAERIAAGKRIALYWIGGFVGALFLVLTICIVTLRRRLSLLVSWTISGLVCLLSCAFSGLQVLALFTALDTFAHQLLGRIENLNLRLGAATIEQPAEALDHLLQAATYDSPIRFANLLRDGVVMAASNPQERGSSIVDRVRSNTFHSLDAATVQIIDPIIVERQRFAALQVGVSVTPIDRMVRRTITINGVAIGVAILLGAGALTIIRRKYAARFAAISSAVNQLREGGITRIDAPTAEFQPLAQSLNRLSREFSEKEELLALARRDADPAARSALGTWGASGADPQVTKTLIERFEQMEQDNARFRDLRHTEALGQAPAWLRCLRDAAIRSKDKEPVVILGPSGAGKTSVARVIHALSPRQSQAMGELNCAELAAADPLVVLGKLFGYGANSGIVGIDKGGQTGLLEEYDGGTLFLDEVGILPMQAQQLLLLPLEGRAFNPAAGKGTPKQVDVRCIFATNEPLEILVSKGLMRHDLLRRIQGRGIISVPALMQRTEDIALLAQHFLGQLNRKQGTHCRFHPDVVTLLTMQAYAEYNISELRGIVHQAYDNTLFDNAQQITLAHVPKTLKQHLPGALRTEASPTLYDDDEQRLLHTLRENDFNITRAEAQLGYAPGAKTLTNHFRGLIYKTLAITRGDIAATTRALIGGRDDCQEKVKTKIVHYIDMLQRQGADGGIAKLITNLPQKYHAHLAAAAQVIQSI